MKNIWQAPITLCAFAAALVVGQNSYAGNTAYDTDVDTVDGAIVHYGMDETSGTSAANSGSGGTTYTGTYGSGVTLGQSSVPSFDVPTSSNLNTSVLNTDPGTATGYTINTSSSPISTGDFTAEAWFNTSTTGPYQQLIFDFARQDLGYNSGLSIYLTHDAITASDNGTNNNGVNLTTASGSIASNTWYMVDFVRVDGNEELYLDGQLVSTSYTVDPITGALSGGNAEADTVNLSSDLGIGGGSTFSVGPVVQNGATSEFSGKIDEVALYGTALSQTQIDATYALGTGIFVPDAVAAVPEPSTWAMMLGGLALLIVTVRRRGATLS